MPSHALITSALVTLLSLTGSALAQTNPISNLTAQSLIEIAPKSASCDGANPADECATAEQAVPHIINSFTKYDITHGSVQAALVSLITYESGDFRYNKNHYPSPGTPGKGTRNMQSPDFNKKYAASLGLSTAGGPQDVADRVEGDADASFGSAAWFVTSQCPISVRRELWGGGEAGWESYLTGCVGTAATEERRRYWQAAVRALGSD